MSQHIPPDRRLHLGQTALPKRVLGMTGRVEIVTGKESLLSLLLKKVRRTISLG